MHIMQSAEVSDYTKMVYYKTQHQHYAQQLSESLLQLRTQVSYYQKIRGNVCFVYISMGQR